MKNEAKSFIQDTAGYPLTLLLVIVYNKRAMQNIELMSWTQLTDKTLARHLDTLETHGYIQHTSKGWTMVEGLQLDIFKDLPFLQNEIEDPDSEKFRLDATTTTLLKLSNNEVKAVVADNGVGIFPTPEVKPNPNYAENFKVCLKFRVGEPARTRICGQFDPEDKPITPAFIQAHIDSRKRGETLGLVIMRIENNEMPRIWAEQGGEQPAGVNEAVSKFLQVRR